VVAIGAAVIVSQREMAAATRAFASRQIAASEEERRRVAGELHDDVSQQIAVWSQRLEALQERMGAVACDASLVHAVEEIGDGLRALAGTVRDLAHQMHPSMLDHLGLGAGLQTLGQEIARDCRLAVQVQVGQGSEDVEPAVALTLYRVAQEALRNVQKHAGANGILVTTWRNGEEITLEVADDGRGFQADYPGDHVGLGLTSMRERVRLAGGEFRVLSEPGRGTVVSARVPARREIRD